MMLFANFAAFANGYVVGEGRREDSRFLCCTPE